MIKTREVETAAAKKVNACVFRCASLIAGVCCAALLFLMTAKGANAAQTITVHSNISLTATASDLSAGEMQELTNLIQWSSDTSWIITIKSLNADMGQSDDFSYTKLLSDLKWKLTGLPTWNTMTTSDATVKLGSTGSGSFNVDYKVLLSWANDKKGTYCATIQYTISPN
jgi:hypothetical protein